MAENAQSRIDSAIRALLKKRVIVGIPSDATQSAPQGKSAPPLWYIGYLNEFGDEEMHIPPRPFLVPGVQDVRDQIVGELRLAAANALAGSMDGMDNHLHAVGLVAQGAVKAKLTNGPFTPLKPGTIYNRRHRKGPPDTPPPNMRTTPLIDTGDLFKAVNYVVRG